MKNSGSQHKSEMKPNPFNTVNRSFYTYAGNNPLHDIDLVSLDLTPAQQVAIVGAAKDWSSSNVPYLYSGAIKQDADCSGLISAIHAQANINIGRITIANIVNDPHFSKVDGEPQVVDVARFTAAQNGAEADHVVLCGGNNPRSDRNAWSASHLGGRSFGSASTSWYGDGKPTYYRFSGANAAAGSAAAPKPFAWLEGNAKHANPLILIE